MTYSKLKTAERSEANSPKYLIFDAKLCDALHSFWPFPSCFDRWHARRLFLQKPSNWSGASFRLCERQQRDPVREALKRSELSFCLLNCSKLLPMTSKLRSRTALLNSTVAKSQVASEVNIIIRKYASFYSQIVIFEEDKNKLIENV